MSRLLTLGAGAMTIAAAVALYAMKFDTRRVEGEVHGLERAIEKAASDIAVLKAERAYLGRPDRIDTLARGMGLGPARETQYRRLDARDIASLPGPAPARGKARIEGVPAEDAARLLSLIESNVAGSDAASSEAAQSAADEQAAQSEAEALEIARRLLAPGGGSP
ncbi:MAG: hypothetical protein SFW09_19085 [Hyphomicrobiaceae bacterium]|nr:hypothetical protein [Hyphomicrobiaceae bacterium]